MRTGCATGGMCDVAKRPLTWLDTFPRCYPPRRWEAEAGGGHRVPLASLTRCRPALGVMNALWHTLRPELRDEDISGLPRVPVWSLDQTEELLRLTQQCLSAFRFEGFARPALIRLAAYPEDVFSPDQYFVFQL